MMTNSELTRLRRQMHRRIRVVLAQRRVDIPAAVHTPQRRSDAAGPPDGSSGEPAAED